jgi:hypothetical protein
VDEVVSRRRCAVSRRLWALRNNLSFRRVVNADVLLRP